MKREEIEATVKRILYEHLGTPIEAINITDNICDDMGADSLDIVELTISYDLEFGIDLEDIDPENFNTVQQHIDAIEEKVNVRNRN